MLGRDGRQLKRVEAQRDEALAADITDGLGKASKLKKKADKHKANAKLAAEKTKAILEARSEKDQPMDDLLSDWKSKRVRE
jgi:hypothetical protein